jgi:hypothetical protein
MSTATVAITCTTLQSNCTVSVRASERSDSRLQLELKATPELENDLGDRIEEGLIRYFCREGLTHARRRLGLNSGLAVDILELKGTIRKGAEIGISYAIAIAIAESLSMPNCQSLLGDMENWEATTTTS